MTIPIGITAKNEGTGLLKVLTSLREAAQYAEQRLTVKFEFYVILNDNTDNSEILLQNETALTVLKTYGGLVEAQRCFSDLKKDSDFIIFSDADILIEKNALFETVQTLLTRPEVEVSYAEKHPLKPENPSILAQALYYYNLRNGYQQPRSYFNGQLFAIRNWNIPEAQNLKWEPRFDSNFLNLKAGIRCDDIFLSRDLLKRIGPQSISCVNSAIWYKTPETLTGMHRKYQRMRLEIERLNIFFPDSIKTHQMLGKRQLQKKLILRAPAKEIFYYSVFLIALSLCKILYNFEKFYYTYISNQMCPTWKPISETKLTT